MAEKVPYLFLGSEPIGPIALAALERNDYAPAAVVTNPKIPLQDLLDLVEETKSTFILVVGFGAILKRPLLDSVAGQVLNIHPSLLPQYRGPAPVVQTILDGARETGVTLIEIDSKVDHGPIIAQEAYALHGNETPAELYKVLTEKGVRLLLDTIDDYLSSELEPLPQEHDEATFTQFIKKEDGKLDLNSDPYELERKVRAFQGWPGTWVERNGKRLQVHYAHVVNNQLAFDEVQPEGGKRMSLSAYLAGQRISEKEFYASLT